MTKRKLTDAEQKAIEDYQADLDNDHLGPGDEPVERPSRAELARLRIQGIEKTQRANEQLREVVRRNAEFAKRQSEADEENDEGKSAE